MGRLRRKRSFEQATAFMTALVGSWHWAMAPASQAFSTVWQPSLVNGLMASRRGYWVPSASTTRQTNFSPLTARALSKSMAF